MIVVVALDSLGWGLWQLLVQLWCVPIQPRWAQLASCSNLSASCLWHSYGPAWLHGRSKACVVFAIKLTLS